VKVTGKTEEMTAQLKMMLKEKNVIQ